MLVRKVLVLVLVAAFTASLLVATAPPAHAARTWSVIAGGGTKDVSVVANAFFPRMIEVADGDTVTWKFQGFHNVVFLGGEQPPSLEVQEGNKTYFNPQVFFPVGGKTYDGTGYHNSGVPPDDPKAAAKFAYSLTFTKAGAYPYVCLIHGPERLASRRRNAERVLKERPRKGSFRGRSNNRISISVKVCAWAITD